jgi:hypothetical protein
MSIHYATVVADLDRARVLGLLRAEDQLRAFLRDDRIIAMPAKQAKRQLLLDAVAQAFEPGVRYSEAVVSDFLATIHDDYAALRRYLVDSEFLSRDHGVYWRSAGTVDSGTVDSGTVDSGTVDSGTVGLPVPAGLA